MKMGIARFTANAAGAALGIGAYNRYVVPALPAALANTRFVPEIIAGATALVGAMIGNKAYSMATGQ